MKASDDPRIQRGMTTQFAARRARLGAGEKPIGWKVGFGAAASLQRLKIDKPLVGFLTDRSPLPSGDTFSLAGVKQAIVEPEIAVYIGRNLHAGSDRETARTAIAALGPAIEINDLDFSPDEPEPVLAGNIYHRRVVLGPRDERFTGARLDGLSARVLRGATEVPAPAALEANTGNLIDIVRHVADVLGAFGETLRAGEFIIAGSIVPPILLEPQEDSVTFALAPLGEIGVRFARG